jgi:hypothetical protein
MGYIMFFLLGVVFLLLMWHIIEDEYPEPSLINIIKRIIWASFIFIASVPLIVTIVLYIWAYIMIAYDLLANYMEVIYPVVLLYMVYIVWFYKSVFKWRVPKVKNFKEFYIFIFIFILGSFLWLFPASLLSKILLEDYIEKVALEKYGQQIDAHIQMDAFNTDNAHAWAGSKLWSFEKKDFIEYEYNSSRRW